MTIKRISIKGTVILAGIALMAMVGCGGSTSTTAVVDALTSAEVKLFSNHGFSLEYPKNYSIWQDGLLDDGANENSGLVQVAPAEGQLPLFAVTWVNTWQWGLEGGLEAGFDGIENWEGVESIAKGELVQSTKKGHRMLYQVGHPMLYQYYNATTDTVGEIVYGIAGAFYCYSTQRAFGLVTIESTTNTPSTPEALNSFEGYLDSIVCH